MRRSAKGVLGAVSLALAVVLLAAGVNTSAYVSPRLHAGQTLQATITYTRQGLLGSAPQVDTTQMNARIASVQGAIAHIDLTLQEGSRSMSAGYDYDTHSNQLLQNGRPVKSRNSVVGMFYNPSVWGQMPARIHTGQTWTVRTEEDDYTPAGTMKVTVAQLDPADGRVVLVRDGSGVGPTEVTSQMKATTQTGDASGTTGVQPGRTTWHGRIELVHGIAVRNEFSASTKIQIPASGGAPRRDTAFDYAAVLTGTAGN